VHVDDAIQMQNASSIVNVIRSPRDPRSARKVMEFQSRGSIASIVIVVGTPSIVPNY